MPRPVSTAHAASTTLSLPGTSGTVNIPFVGSPVESNVAPPDRGSYSLLKMMELQFVGTGALNDGTYDDSANLQYVGISSDYAAEGNSLAATVFQFGMVAYADHAAPDGNNTYFEVDIDTTGGRTYTPNYVTSTTSCWATTGNYENIYVPFVVNIATGVTTSPLLTDVYSGPGGPGREHLQHERAHVPHQGVLPGHDGQQQPGHPLPGCLATIIMCPSARRRS